MKKNQPLNNARRCLVGRLPLFLFASGAVFTGTDSLFGGLSPAYASQQLDLKPGKIALSDIALASDGGTISLSKWAGRPLLINFWATWCAPCIAELPALSRAAAALAGDGITVLLVSIDRGGAAKAMTFLKEHGVTGVKLGFDPKARLSREMKVRGLPTTLFLPAGQDAAWRFVGPFEWDDQAMLDLLRGFLAE